MAFAQSTGAVLLNRPRDLETDRLTCQHHSCALWVTTGPTAALLHALGAHFGLDWRLNDVVRPDLLVLTNLGGTDPAQIAARCRPRKVVLCLDDRAGRTFRKRADLPCFTYSEGRNEADLTAHDLRILPSGVSFLAVTRNELAKVSVPTGDLYHALASLACACVLGIPLSTAAQAVSELLYRCEAVLPASG